MGIPADKDIDNKSKSVANAVSQEQSKDASTFQFIDNRPEFVAKRKLQEMANNSPQVKQAVQLQAMADNSSGAKREPAMHTHQTQGALKISQTVQNVPVQRIIETRGGGEKFEDIVYNFCLFAKKEGGLAYEMLDWFWHGENNTLEIVSVEELDAKGYTDCQIAGKRAHELSDEEWGALPVDAPVKIILSIKEEEGGVFTDETKQYYVILHELLVHGFPFYSKIRPIREGGAPKSRAEAGYHEGPDAMGAHVEHQDLLHGDNKAFSDLYSFIQSEIMTFIFGDGLPEGLAGFNLSDFTNMHEIDLMIQYTETTNAKYKMVSRRLNKVLEYFKNTFGRTSSATREKAIELFLNELNEIKLLVQEAWREYYHAYEVHTEKFGADLPENRRDQQGDLPYFNMNAWNNKTLTKLAATIENVKKADTTIDNYIKQLKAVHK